MSVILGVATTPKARLVKDDKETYNFAMLSQINFETACR